MTPPEMPLRDRIGRRFSRIATTAVVARPKLWRLFRGPMRGQFDRLAGGWDTRLGVEALAPLRAALERVPAPRRALDLGTGSGKGARVLAEMFPGATVIGADLSPAMIEQARALLPAAFADRVSFEVADASALPYEDGSFDLVVLLNMIPFFPELGRLTAEGGAVIVSFSFGAATPIFVPSKTLEERLRHHGFASFEEIEAGPGTALVARKETPPPRAAASPPQPAPSS
jgi:SAM-dependent methyltransferase